MKNLLGIGAAFVAGLGIGGGLVHILASSNPVSQSPSRFLTELVTGSDQYEIRWTGRTGGSLIGGYAIAYPYRTKKPMRAESVNARLPYAVKLSAPKGSSVSASGDTLRDGAVEITILRNGKECGEAVVTGSGVGANKMCASQ